MWHELVIICGAAIYNCDAQKVSRNICFSMRCQLTVVVLIFVIVSFHFGFLPAQHSSVVDETCSAVQWLELSLDDKCSGYTNSTDDSVANTRLRDDRTNRRMDLLEQEIEALQFAIELQTRKVRLLQSYRHSLLLSKNLRPSVHRFLVEKFPSLAQVSHTSGWLEPDYDSSSADRYLISKHPLALVIVSPENCRFEFFGFLPIAPISEIARNSRTTLLPSVLVITVHYCGDTDHCVRVWTTNGIVIGELCDLEELSHFEISVKHDDTIVVGISPSGTVSVFRIEVLTMEPAPCENGRCSSTPREPLIKAAVSAESVCFDFRFQPCKPNQAVACLVLTQGCRFNDAMPLDGILVPARHEVPYIPVILPVSFRSNNFILISDVQGGISVFSRPAMIFKGRHQVGLTSGLSVGLVAVPSNVNGHVIYFTPSQFGYFNPMTVNTVGYPCIVGARASISSIAIEPTKPFRIVVALQDGQVLLFDGKSVHHSCPQFRYKAPHVSSSALSIAFMRGRILAGALGYESNACNVYAFNATAITSGSNDETIFVKPLNSKACQFRGIYRSEHSQFLATIEPGKTAISIFDVLFTAPSPKESSIGGLKFPIMAISIFCVIGYQLLRSRTKYAATRLGVASERHIGLGRLGYASQTRTRFLNRGFESSNRGFTDIPGRDGSNRLHFGARRQRHNTSRPLKYRGSCLLRPSFDDTEKRSSNNVGPQRLTECRRKSVSSEEHYCNETKNSLTVLQNCLIAPGDKHNDNDVVVLDGANINNNEINDHLKRQGVPMLVTNSSPNQAAAEEMYRSYLPDWKKYEVPYDDASSDQNSPSDVCLSD